MDLKWEKIIEENPESPTKKLTRCRISDDRRFPTPTKIRQKGLSTK